MIKFNLLLNTIFLLLFFIGPKTNYAQQCEAKTLYYEKLDVADVRPVIKEMKTYVGKNTRLLTADCSRRMNYLVAVCYEITGMVDSAATYFNIAKQAAKLCGNDTAVVETYLLASSFFQRHGKIAESKLIFDTAYFALRRYMYKSDYDMEGAPSFYVNLDDPILGSNKNAIGFKERFTPTQLFLLRSYYQIKGNYYLLNNKPEEAKKNLLLSYQFAKANLTDSSEGYILNNLGLLLSNEGFYQRAVEFLNESLLLSEKQNAPAAMVNTLLNLSFCYRKVKKISDAETYASRALEICKRNGYSALLCRSSSFTARALGLQNKPAAAEKIMRESIDTANKYKLMDELAYNYRSLAQMMLENNYKIPEVKLLVEKSRKLILSIPDSSFLNATDFTLGNYYLKTGNLTKALTYTSNSLNFSYRFNDYAEIDGVYKQMADVYMGMKNYRMANIYLQKYEGIKDSLTNREVQLSLQDMERKYDNQSKLLKISGLEKDRKEKEFLLKQNKNRTRLFIYIAAATLLAAVSFFYFNRKLAHQKKELEISNEKLQHLTGVQNRLFRIIGHDLKSMIIPFSRAGKIMQSYLSKNETTNTVLYANKLEENSLRLSSTVNNLLFWSVQQLDGYQIRKEQIAVRENIDFVLDTFDELIRLKNIEIINLIKDDEQLYTDKEGFQIILRNIISNSIKFMDAGAITIFSETNNLSYTLHVRDEGAGMSNQKIEQLHNQPLQETTNGTHGEKGSGIGFSIIKKIASLNGGTVAIKSCINKGTTISISFPVSLNNNIE